MPLVREFRFFVFDGKLVTRAPYWELNDGGSAGVPEGGTANDFYVGLREATGATA